MLLVLGGLAFYWNWKKEPTPFWQLESKYSSNEIQNRFNTVLKNHPDLNEELLLWLTESFRMSASYPKSMTDGPAPKAKELEKRGYLFIAVNDDGEQLDWAVAPTKKATPILIKLAKYQPFTEKTQKELSDLINKKYVQKIANIYVTPSFK